MWFAWRLSGLPTRQSGNQGRHASGSGAAYALTLAVMACKPSLILGGKLLGAGECFEVVLVFPLRPRNDAAILGLLMHVNDELAGWRTVIVLPNCFSPPRQ